MRKQPVIRFLAVLLIALISNLLFAESIPVRYTAGLLHGFLVLRNQTGEVLADGEVTQIAHGDQVTNHLTLHFKDGSLNEETVVFSQHRNFQLISDHLVQKGPSFPHPMDVLITKSTGQITIRYTDEDGKEKTISDRLTLPLDVANGLTQTLIENIRTTTPKTTVSMVATTPKPRLVKLVITPSGQEPFTVGNSKHTAMHYVIKIDIGGVAGAVAPIVGKQPSDLHVWIAGEEAPVLVKMEGPLYNEGPIWRIEMASPTWPQESKGH